MVEGSAPDVRLRPELVRALDGVVDSAAVEFRVVDAPDAWLDACYQMLVEEFDTSVLDPRERYVEWLGMNAAGSHPFPLLLMAAYVRDGERALVVGVSSGNIMPLLRADGSSAGPPVPYLYAIGHQVTSALLRNAGLTGVGRRLFAAALDQASRWVAERGGSMEYAALEAETESLGFWTKMGFLWPQGVRYWQPPLEFDAVGDYRCPEVPEILMLRAKDGTSSDTLGRAALLDIVATIYRNWSLHKYRSVLSGDAMVRAERYVMQDLLGRVRRQMPEADPLKLVRVQLGDSPPTTRRRSIALSEGIQHNLTPLRALQPSEIEDLDDLLRAMEGTAFGGRLVGEAARVLDAMASDAACRVVLTLSGAVTISKLDLLIAEMIDRGLVHCIVTTGAVVVHGFNAERGKRHFKAPDGVEDAWLFEQGYDRIFDTIETEAALDELQDIMAEILRDRPPERVLCSSEIVEALGAYLVEHGDGNGLIQAAYRRGVPVFIPAFTDSEIGLDFALFNYYRRRAGGPELRFDPFLDFERYADFTRGAVTRGIVTLGGGVPRNWAQQIGPYLEAMERRENAVAVAPARFSYGVRICPDPPFWGGLSGSTYSEGVTWGKFVPLAEGGRFAEVPADFSLVFPLLIKGLFQRLDKRAASRPAR